MKTQHLGDTFDHLAKKRFCEKYFLGLYTVKFSNNVIGAIRNIIFLLNVMKKMKGKNCGKETLLTYLFNYSFIHFVFTLIII